MPFDVTEGRAILARTPGVLDALLRDLDDEWVRRNEGPATFSPFDVVGHLIHGEREDWIPRARIILEHGAARAFDPFDRFAQFETSRGKSLNQLLDEFAALRGESLAALDGLSLTPENLALQGRHPAHGLVTLGELLATWVAHDLGHIAQVARVMAGQHREDVGPWGRDLPILTVRRSKT